MASWSKTSSNGYTLTLEVYEKSYSITSNTSDVHAKLTLHSGPYNRYDDYGTYEKVWINGSAVLDRYTPTSFSSHNQTITLWESDVTGIAHNADGTKTISCSASISYKYSDSYLPGSMSVSGSLALTTIPRASSVSMSPQSVACGGTTKFTISPASTSFRHILYYKLGSESWAQIKDIAAGTTTYTWTVPMSFADSYPNNASFSVPILCETYNGNSSVGSKQATLTITVPSNFKPTISGITVSEESTDAQKFNLSGNYVKSLSKIRATISINSENAHGATVKSYSSTLDSIPYSGESFESNILSTAGLLDLASIITDSRGHTSSRVKQLTVIDYAVPAITLEVHQSGSSVVCAMKGNVYPVNDGSADKNTKSLVIRWKRTSDSSWEDSETIPLNDWEFEETFIATLAHPDETYVFEALLTDKIQTSTAEASTGIVCISRLKGGKGVCFFQEATREGVWAKNVRLDLTESQYDELSSLLGGDE